MPRFSYIASTSKGESIRGTLDASSKNDVAKILGTKGLFMISCKVDELSVTSLAPLAAPGSPMAQGSILKSSSSIRPDAVAVFFFRSDPAQPSFHKWWETFTHKQRRAG